MCHLIFLLLLMANIVPQYLLGDAAKCYEASRARFEPIETDCPIGVCFLMKCSGDDESKSYMSCGNCLDGQYPPSCKCNECNEKDLCNEPIGPIKQCYGEGRSTSSAGGFEYEKVECKFYNNDGCKTIEPLGGAKNARDLEKSCGKCPEEKYLSKGKMCTTCNSSDSCNDKVVGKCYMTSSESADPTETSCLSDDCYLMQCIGPSGSESRMGCGTCSDQGHEGPDCKCTPCKGHLCNQPKAFAKCYEASYNSPVPKVIDCLSDDCFLMQCSGSESEYESRMGCGTCSNRGFERPDCECTNCKGDLCNQLNVSAKQCYIGPDVSGKFKPDKCMFFNSDGCKTIESIADSRIIKKSCGKCPKEPDSSSKCSDCIGDLCNNPVDKGTIKQCYGGDEGNYNEEDCKFYNNDGCHTIVCDDKKDKKGCGKCPPSEKLETMGSGCKCEECDGELCNKELTVNQCYFGDDQKGYEPMDCTAPQNMACKNVKCRGAGDYSIDPETGKRGSGFAKNYRECGKCEDMPDTCKCLQCNDKDLCNSGLRIGSPIFVLVMIGGVVALVAMKPLVGIGI